MRCVTLEDLGEVAIRRGDVVHACAVSGANVVRDAREAITNIVGGKMSRYESVLDQTMARALEALQEKAAAAGYDGVVGVRFSHPHITEGAIEVVVAGTGFRYAVPGVDPDVAPGRAET